MLDRLRRWAAVLHRHVLTLWFVARDPETPLAARIVACAVAAYAFSPIDLIPDFIPLLGLLDEAILLHIGIALALRLVSAPLLARAQGRAAEQAVRPVSLLAAAGIIACWIGVAGLAYVWWR